MHRGIVLPWLLRIWRHLPRRLRHIYLRTRYGHVAVGVSGLIRDEAGRILMVHRTYSPDEPWALPGGWLERRDGSLGTALERELHEETGLRVRAGGVRAVERAGFALVVLLSAELLDPTASFRASAEVSQVAWVDPSQVRAMSSMNRRLLRQALP